MKTFQRFSQQAFILTIAWMTLSTLTPAQAQMWSDGMYHNGMHEWNWGGKLPIVTVKGKAAVDSLTPFMKAYYIDTVGNGNKHVQLYFGPWWYEPASGAKRPSSGQSITVKGSLSTFMSPPMLVVYEINGLQWRDSVGAPPWSGGWVRRNGLDTTFIFCPTDSLAWIGFPRGFMGMGMMGNGMMWPDSLYALFEQMHADSLPGAHRGWGLMGYHLDLFNPQGGSMMSQLGTPHGMIGVQQNLQLRFRVHPDSLRNLGLALNDMRLMFYDGNQWKLVPGQTVNTLTNTITTSQSSTYSFYAIVPASVTSAETAGPTTPASFVLEQNYPNPFNPATTIAFSLPRTTRVSLRIYNVIGNEVATLINGAIVEAGFHVVRLDASHLPSGTYFYTLQTPDQRVSRKMLLLK